MDGFDQDKIVLDQKTFKALANNTRVEILKELSKRRKTQTELAHALGLSVVTIKEHLGKMSDVHLIKQKDDGHKWKYYDLTEKGKCVLFPERKKILIVLISILFVASFALFSTFNDVDLTSIPNVNTLMSVPMAKSFGAQDTQVETMAVESDSIDGAVNEQPEMMAMAVSDDEINEESEIEASGIMRNEDLRAKPEVKYPVLRYISYTMLLILVGLLIYYMVSYNYTKKKI